MTVGEKIREIRNQLGMTVRAFGKFVDYDFSQISRIERGSEAPTRKPPDPSLNLISQICNAANYDLALFLEETGYIKKKSPTVSLVEDENEAILIDIYRALPEDDQRNVLAFAKSAAYQNNIEVSNQVRKLS